MVHRGRLFDSVQNAVRSQPMRCAEKAAAPAVILAVFAVVVAACPLSETQMAWTYATDKGREA